MGQEVKQRILEAAKEKFHQFGFKKATVDEISEKAVISKRTIYENFNSKEEILSDLIVNEAYTVRKVINQKLKEALDPVDKLTTFFDYSEAYFTENPFLRQVLNDARGMFSPFLKDEIFQVENGIKSLIKEVVAEGIEKAVFRNLDVDAVTDCIYVLYWNFVVKNVDEDQKDRIWIDFILNAVLKHSHSNYSHSE